MIEQLEKGTPITWRRRGFGYQPSFTGVIKYMSYQDNPIESVHVDLENPNDDLIIHATNVKNQFDSDTHDMWLYASQLKSVDTKS